MDVPAADAHLLEIAGQLLGHPLGERRDQYPLVALGPEFDLADQVVDLVGRGPNLDLRIQQPCGPNHLFDHHPLRLVELVVGRRGAHVDRLRHQRLELLELQRAVVDGRRKTEPVLHEVLFPGVVAAVHGPDLRDGDMALVDNHQKILREVVQQAERTGSGQSAVEVARVVLDAGTVAQLFDHFEVVFDALFEPLGVLHLAALDEEVVLGREVVLDLDDGRVDAVAGGDEDVGRVDRDAVELREPLAGERVDGVDLFDRVAPLHDPIGFVAVGHVDVDRVARHAEGAPAELRVVARVEAVHQLVQELLARKVFALFQVDRVGVEVRRVADPVEARHGAHHHHVVAAGEQRTGGAQAEFLDFVVDREVLFDVGVRGGEVGLRLVVVVVRDEVFDGIVGKETPELAVELGGQGFVVAQDQGRFSDVPDDVGHREGLARAGDSEEGVVARALAERTGQLGDRLGLVARRREVGVKGEVHGRESLFRKGGRGGGQERGYRRRVL